MSRIRIDDSELRELGVDLSKAPMRIQFGASKVVRRGARVIDGIMRRDAAGHIGNYFGRPGTEYVTPMDRHVSHEMLTPLSAEIGIETKGAGSLAHIIVYGSVNNAPVYDHTINPRRALPGIEKDMGDEGEGAVLGGKK